MEFKIFASCAIRIKMIISETYQKKFKEEIFNLTYEKVEE